MCRDFQKSRVYAWEDAVILPRTNVTITFERAQMFIDGVWLAMGKIGAPRAELISKRIKTAVARGCRPYIEIREATPAWVILHELAHSLTMDHDHNGDGHGPKFVAAYMRLLDKVLGIPLALTIYSAQVHGVQFEQPY